MNIRLRLTLWFTGLVALIVGIGALWGWLGVRSHVYNLAQTEIHDKQAEIQAFIDGLAREFSRQDLNFDLRRNADNLQDIFANDQTSLYANIYIQITDLDGHIIARSSNLGRHSLPVQLPDGQRHVVGEPYLQMEFEHGKDTDSILYARSTLMVNDQPQGFLQLGLSVEKSEKLVNQLLFYELMGLLLSLLASIWLGQFLAQRALEPMLQITGQVQAMAGQDLFRRLDTEQLNPDEIGLLAKTFNDLLGRIEAVFQSQRHFLADASHEFRTPLTAIRGHAQLIEKRGSDEQVRARSAATIIRESRRLSRLVDDLLLLARLESRTTLTERLDLAVLVQEVYEDLEPLQPSLRLDAALEPLILLGHEDSLRRVLINLLDNAFHAVKGAEREEVTLSCWRNGNDAEIMIEDSGMGIAPEHLPRLFERFYRVEHDRSRDTGGSGIGLALVYEIVRLHRGQVEVESELGKGTRFKLRFPLQTNTTVQLGTKSF